MEKITTTKGYEFVEKGHKHLWNGVRMSGVTTILGVIAKPFLYKWYSDMAVDYIKDNLKRDDLITQTDFDLVLEEARKAGFTKRDDAGQKGTDVHAIIESIIKVAIQTNQPLNGGDSPIPQVKHFINWATTNKVKFLESEKKVWSEKLFCAGICDFVCEINGEKLVGDIKTGSGIYPEHFYQVAAYRLFLEEMGEQDFKGSVIVNLKKDGKFNEDEDVIISYGYEEEKEAFLSAHKLYRITNNFKTKNKYSKAL